MKFPIVVEITEETIERAAEFAALGPIRDRLNAVFQSSEFNATARAMIFRAMNAEAHRIGRELARANAPMKRKEKKK